MPLIRFDEFEFDTHALRLRHRGEPVEAQPRVLEMLAYLIQRPGQLVTKEALVEALWDIPNVADDTVTKRIGLLRQALRDTGRERRYIQTLYGKGVRFVGEIVTGETKAEPSPAVVARQPMDETITLEEQAPALVVLPLRQIGEDGPFAEIARGLPDDITSALVKLRSLRIIARGSAFRYMSGSTPLADLRRDLGVRYAVGGSIETSADGLRIYIELVRTRDEGVVWSENYRIGVDEIHALRDELVGRIVNQVDISIPQQEAARAALKMPSKMEAWEAYHLGQSLGVETMEPDFPRAEVYLRRAVEAAPGFVRAHSALAFVHWNFFTEKRDEKRNRELMLVEAEKAVALDPDDPMARIALGTMVGTLGDIDTGRMHVERSLELAPSFARAYAAVSGFQTAGGKLAESLASIDRAVTLSPRDPHLSRWLAIRLVNHCLLQNNDAVRETAAHIDRLGSGQVSALGWALTGFSIAGDTEAAGRVARRLRAVLPGGKSEGIPGVYSSLPPMLQAMLAKAFADHGLLA